MDTWDEMMKTIYGKPKIPYTKVSNRMAYANSAAKSQIRLLC